MVAEEHDDDDDEDDDTCGTFQTIHAAVFPRSSQSLADSLHLQSVHSPPTNPRRPPRGRKEKRRLGTRALL